MRVCVSPLSQNAIREKTQALNFLKLSSRIEGVCSRLEAAVKMNQLTENMKGVVEGMDTALKEMDTTKVRWPFRAPRQFCVSACRCLLGPYSVHG